MKKILEIHQYDDMDIRFDTDIDVTKSPEQLIELHCAIMFSMATKLWGGNETSVIAIIRSLALADLALSVNRKDMLKQLDESSEALAKSYFQATEEMKKRGYKVATFGPGVNKPS